MKMSDQMVASIALTLLQSLMDQTDIVPVLKGFEVAVDGEELVILNPPETPRVELPQELI
jgi:hypothetical protein